MRRSLAVASIALVISCGRVVGGGLGGGSASLAGGGVGGSGISSGAITGFGSIFVTGTEYDTAGATIDRERQPSSASALRVGMVVVVEGDRAAGGLTGTAQKVSYDDEIEGPIDALTSVSDDLEEAVILGQVVTLERDLTRFDAAPGQPTPTFDTLAIGDVVEVSGFRRAADIQATYVQKKGVDSPLVQARVELKGTVSGVAGRTFMVDTIRVTWDASTILDDLPSGGPTNGDFVEVEGVRSAAADVRASRIEREGPFAGDVDDFEIEGTVTRFASLASFRVAGQLVDASGANVQFEPNDRALVRNGVRVEVEGALSSGTVIAEKVVLREGEVVVHAAIAAAGDIQAASSRVILLGIPVQIAADTQLVDDLLGVPSFGVDDMVVGDFLEVRGVDDGTGGVMATELERDQAGDVRLRGRVAAIGAMLPRRSVTILGAVVPTDPGTRFIPGSIQNESDFYATVQVGDLLDVTDLQDGDEAAIDVADEIELWQGQTGARGRRAAP